MPEMRLIDANALQRKTVKVETAVEFNGRKRTCYFDSNVVPVEDIENTPTIDAVPVVRCKDCKFRGFDFCPMCHDEYTYDEDDGGDYYTVDNTEDDGFCYKGAKMDGGAEG